MSKERVFKYGVSLMTARSYERNWRYFRTESEAIAFAESEADLADTIWFHNGQIWTISKIQPSYTYGR